MRTPNVAPALVVTVAAVTAIVTGRQTADGQRTLDRLRPFETYGHVYDPDNVEAMRPRVMGTRGVIASGHYLATEAGLDVLKAGGNAFDAGVAAAMTLKVTKMDYAGWNGVAPLIAYSAADRAVVTRIGAGRTPAAATLEYFLEHGKTATNTALIPADVDVWLAALARYGTLSFADAARGALDAAEHGYHMHKMQKWMLDRQTQAALRYPYNAAFWFQHGVGRQRVGDLMVNRDLGRLIRYLMTAERDALMKGGTREDGLRAARDAFYAGAPARAAVDFLAKHGGILTYDDLSTYDGAWVASLHTTYEGYDIHVPDGWSQGPRLILFLNLLRHFDVRALGFNTPDYIHLLSQVIALGMADSHRYIGDPDVVDIPPALFSNEYAVARATLVDMERAFPDMPPWGDPTRGLAVANESPSRFTSTDGAPDVPEPDPLDTSSLNVMDAEGNLFSLTQSDSHIVSPMIPGWGFGLGRRMAQFNMDPALANVMAPEKRPRNTNAPVLVMKAGEPVMGLSTPGADQQLQAILQALLNVIVWDMSPEHALDQPRFGSQNFPTTGSEVNRTPARLNLEDRIPAATADALRARGHDVRSWGLWSYLTGAVTVTYRAPGAATMIAAGDVRRETVALGY